MVRPRVEVRLDERAVAVAAVDVVERVVAQNPHAVLALPTGRTPIALYAELVEREWTGRIDLSQVRSFNLDEWVGIPSTHPATYARFMEEQLFSRLRNRPTACYIPDGTSADLDAECARYESAIREAGGIDLAVLGIGNNGHIGFNEPGTPFDARTHVAEVASLTRQNNAYSFPDGQPPSRAITVGIATILDSRSILLLATGASKAAVLERALAGPVDSQIPASVLQRHPDVVIIADVAASACLSRKL
jgi:glucosamine-6-phosphate deaminase